MKPGRTLKRLRATFGILALILALAGCTVGRLSDRIVIDRMTRVTDCAGQPIPLADNADFIHVSSADQVDPLELDARCDGKTEKLDRGRKLGPGTVLTYVRWSPGYASFEKVASSNSILRHEPASDVYRITLRKVDTNRGNLRPEEERFLASLLTVHRLKWTEPLIFGTTLDERRQFLTELQATLYRSRARLWNSLVEELTIRRVGPGPSKGLNLVPTFRMEALCSALARYAKSLPSGDSKTTAQEDTDRFAKAFLTNPSECLENKGIPLEATGMPKSTLTSIIQGAASVQLPESDGQHPYFAKLDPYAQLNFATAELNGIQVGRSDIPEADWSLREWEDSEICRIPGDLTRTPVIRRVRLAGGRRPLWISRESRDPGPTYQVTSILVPKRSQRRIDRISQVGTFEDRAVLPVSALDILRMSDLDFIEWAIPGEQVNRSKSRVTVEPNGCYFASER